MGETNENEQSQINQAYQIARDMMHIDKFSAAQTKAALIDIGINEQTATAITDAVEQELTDKVIHKSSSNLLLIVLITFTVVAIFWFIFGDYLTFWGMFEILILVIVFIFYLYRR